jgi:hypothetical protein
MKLIWTLDFNNEIKYVEFDYKSKLIDFYKFSISKAKKLGYYTIIYTNKACEDYFVNLVDEIIFLEKYEDSFFFDSFKFKVLEERTDDYYLIDGDVILESKLPIYDEDVTFDAYETNHFKDVYGDAISELLELDTNNQLPIKITTDIIKVINCGVLRITNTRLKEEYVKCWKQFNKLVKNHKIKYVNQQTAVSAQYLLTVLVDQMKCTYKPISVFLGRKNQYYRHYHGNSKYKIEKIISEIKTLI